VDFYKTVGYLPDAIINYLALLGWSLDDKTENFTREELIKNFSLERVNKAPASFDPKKLWSFEDRHFQALPLEKKVASALPFLERAGLIMSSVDKTVTNKVQSVVAAAGDRLKVAGDILNFDEFFLPDDKLPYDEKSFDKHIRKADGALLLKKFKDRLAAVESFDVPTLEKLMHDFVAEQQIKIGQIIHPVRVAVTGKSTGLGMFDTLAILGKTTCLARFDHTLEQA
jgi:glutamyl-tRNA synthetase